MAVNSKKVEIEEKRRRRKKELKGEFQQHLKEYMDLFGVDLSGLEKISVESIPLDLDEEKWTNKKLEEFDTAQLKIPQGMYKDNEVLANRYQEQFMRCIQELCPEVLNELRALSTSFQGLFNNPDESEYAKKSYLSCLRSIDFKLVQPFFSFQNVLNREPRYRSDFLWGNYLPLIALLNAWQLVAKGDDKSNIIDDDVKAFIKDLSYICESVARHVKDVFQKTAGDEARILQNFIELQGGLVNWAIKHHLCKDWIIEYGYYFLWQFYDESATSAVNLEVKRDYRQSLVGHIFEFRENGWLPGEETAEAYRSRLNTRFQEELDKYFDFTSRDLDLESRKNITKPQDVNRVKWLVRKTVQNWTVRQIVDEASYLRDIPYSETTVYTALRDFRKYGLPSRGKQCKNLFQK
ncbi:MAG: hypothetical protein KIS76_12800 [Pyrinomonadaceae bacterium]|nr:hypothetical protein [Pyrinomonadaceae bacterium]